MGMKKIFTLVSFCLSFSLFSASLEERMDKLAEEMQSVYTTNPSHTGGAKFSNANRGCCGATWFITAEALYWHAKSGGTEYAIKLDSAVYPQKGNVKDCDYGWDWGLRVGLGRYLPHDDWYLYLTYTWFDTHDTQSVDSPFETPLGTDTSPGLPGPHGFTKGKFSCKANYDALDFVLGKSFFTSSKLSFHPIIGLKSAWINHRQKLKTIERINATQTTLLTSGVIDSSVKSRCHFWGMGPKIGTSLSWFLSNGFKLVMDVSSTLFYGFFKVSESDRTVGTPTVGPQVIAALHLKGNHHHFVPQARMFAGLHWEKKLQFKESAKYLSLGLGYEVQYFWRVIQCLDQESIAPPNASPAGPIRVDFKRMSEDLAYYGINLWARLDF